MTSLVIDCTELYQNPIRTGIQRVVRELLRHWPHDQSKMRVARFDPDQGLVALPERAIRILTDDDRDSTTMSRDALVNALLRAGQRAAPLPPEPRVFIPEVFYDPARCRFYEGRHPAMLAYDFLPWLHPELFASPTMVNQMPYLRLLCAAPQVAYISQHTRREYETRIARRPACGPVLPLGADGLRIEHQAWDSNRTGYISLGSLDTRKNQHLIVAAFIRLWESGGKTPLTLIGGAFEGHKLSWVNEARRFPFFRWLDTATDADVATAIRTTRATIYVSEAEGYGLPPVESLAAGVPVIAAAGCPSVAMLTPAGTIRLDTVSPDHIAAAVTSFEDDDMAARLWQEAASVRLTTWQEFAQAAAAWLEVPSVETIPSNANSRLPVEHPPRVADAARAARPPTETPMKFAEMYAWWNQAALDNPMTAILSNERKWDPAAFFETGRAWLADNRAFAGAANVEITGRHALDFGCGMGRMTAALSEYYESVVGADISEEMIRLARQQQRAATMQFVQVTEPPLPFADQEFDCVYSTIVVQHIPFPSNLHCVREFFRLSSNVVLFDAPSHLRPPAKPGPGIFMLDHRYVLACAAETGFELIALRSFPATDTRHYQYLFQRIQ
jgi:SAM-dependent methyltransferase/glycosyltransferase involved in cell wall biosynthesis